ncbi:MAG: lipid-A-disaccharide synthase [Pseudomonadota bacterium]
MKVGFVAGEASGDLLGALLLQALHERWPALQAAGIAGPRMQALGCQAWWPQAMLAVRGYAEVLPRLRQLLKMRRALGDRFLADRPDVFIGIDAPDFNFDLEMRLRAAGIPTVHFVSPSFWAWRAEKLRKLKAAADHVLCVFPFEPELLAQHGIAATYVGHPIAQLIPLQPDRAGARAQLGLAEAETVVAVLPGSRQDEIKYLAQRFFSACKHIQQAQSAIKFVVPAVPALRPQIERIAQDSGLGQALHIVSGQSHAVLAACDVTLIASGTATLEAALFKRPMVIAYNMHALSWQIMRRKRLQPWVGLPNILCGEFVVPEFLQNQATPAALGAAVLDWLAAPERVAAVQQRFGALHSQLQRDTATLALNAITSVCQPPPSASPPP